VRTLIIPFSGFYGSWHFAQFDDAEEQLFADDYGDVNHTLRERFYRACDYRHAFEQYAKAYATEFADATDLPLVFESLQSPREYNFRTDRIFCTVGDATIAKLHAETSPDTLRDVAARNHTSRSGFSSFYSPDTLTWGHLDTWDHNQLTTLLEAWLYKLYNPDPDGDIFPQDLQLDLMEGYAGNGWLDAWLCQAPEAAKIVNIACYLRRRAERLL
jgi:hypothetical protein